MTSMLTKSAVAATYRARVAAKLGDTGAPRQAARAIERRPATPRLGKAQERRARTQHRYALLNPVRSAWRTMEHVVDDRDW